MKEQILQALKAKFTGGNANILSRVADMLAKTVTDEKQVATAVEGVTQELIDLIESYGDSRATDTQKTAILNYEKKHGLKNGVKVEQKPTEAMETKPAESNETPSWAKALIESNKQLTERLNKMEGEKTKASRKAVLDGIINKLPEMQRKGYQRISVDTMSDDEFDTLKGEISAEVDEIVKASGARSAVFGRPPSNGSKGINANKNEATEDEANAVVERLNV